MNRVVPNGGHPWERLSIPSVGLTGSPVADVLNALKELAVSLDVYVVTARFPRRLEYAREWLEAHDVHSCIVDVLSSDGRSKPEICAEHRLTCLVDDDARHLDVLTGTPTAAVWFRPGAPAQPVPPGIKVVGTWTEVVSTISVLTEQS